MKYIRDYSIITGVKYKKEPISAAGKFYLAGNSLKETSEFLERKYQLRINLNTLNYHLKKHGFSIRSPKEAITMARRKHINITKVIKIYQKTKSVGTVSRLCNTARGTIKKILVEEGIKLLNNDEAIQKANLKYAKTPFNGNDQEKAYLYGFVLGDVHVFKKSKFTLRAITHTTHKSFVDLFMSEFKKYGKVNCRYKTNTNEWHLWADLDYETFSFLEDRKEDRLPKWVNSKNFLSVLSGFIDSDGSVLIKKHKENFSYNVKVFGQDKVLLRGIHHMLGRFDFNSYFYRLFKANDSRIWKGKTITYNKDYYVVELRRKEEVIKLLQSLTLKHKEKLSRQDQIMRIHGKEVTRWEDIKEEVIKLREQIKEEVITELALAKQDP